MAAAGAGATTIAAGAEAAQASGSGLQPFSRAREFGIDAYTRLQAALSGTVPQAHHIIPARFAEALNLDKRWMLSVAVSPAEHAPFTAVWNELMPRGSELFASAEDVWRAAQSIYDNYATLLEAARQTTFLQY